MKPRLDPGQVGDSGAGVAVVCGGVEFLVPALLAARAPVLADCLTFCRAGGTLDLDTLLFRSRGVPAR